MNIKKNIDYGTMFSTLDVLMTTDLPHMELYYEIGRVVSDNQEKGAAIAAAEYLQSAYPDMIGFSPGTCAGCGNFTVHTRALLRLWLRRCLWAGRRILLFWRRI